MGTTGSAERMQARRVRVWRGTTAAAVAVLLASTAHTLSGGGAPPLWLVAAVVVLAAPLCVALVGRRRSVIRIAASVAVAQVALHAAFAAVGTTAPAALQGAHHHGPLVLAGGTVDPAATTMTAGHALAALLTVVLLAWGERLLAALARGVRRLLRTQWTATALPVAPAPTSFSPRLTAVAATFLLCVIRRGPPAARVPNLAC